jgi:hypothetical protein
MNTINTDLQTFSQPFDLFAFGAVSKAAQDTQIKADSLQQKDITVYTKEGDKVTLTLEARTQLSYSNYQGQFSQISAVGSPNAAALELQNVAVQQETLELAGARTFTVSVEGDLSEQELKDIKTVLQQIDAVMMAILDNGRPQSTPEDLAIKDLDTLAGAEARYYQTGNIVLQQTTYLESDLAAVRQSPSDGPKPEKHGRDLAAKIRDRLEHLIDASHVKPRHLARPLKGYFNNLFKHFSDLKPLDRGPYNLARQIGSDLVKHVSGHA